MYLFCVFLMYFVVNEFFIIFHVSEPAPPKEPRCHGPQNPSSFPSTCRLRLPAATLSPCMVDSTPSSESRLICYDNHIRDDESSEEPTTPVGGVQWVHTAQDGRRCGMTSWLTQVQSDRWLHTPGRPVCPRAPGKCSCRSINNS